MRPAKSTAAPSAPCRHNPLSASSTVLTALPITAANPTYLYLYYIPICGGDGLHRHRRTTPRTTLPRPGAPRARRRHPIPKPPTLPIISPTPRKSSTAPSMAPISDQPFTLGVYNRTNKLPYSINFTLNFQYQPRNDLMIEIGYVGNLGRHQVIPVPFNQSQIATPSNPTHPGGIAQPNPSATATPYSIPTLTFPSASTIRPRPTCNYGTMLNNYEGGNVDLRVPYIGYSSESESYTAAGISAYHALEAHLEKKPQPRTSGRRLLHLLPRHRRTKRPGPVLQRQQPQQPAQRLRLGRFRPHTCI